MFVPFTTAFEGMLDDCRSGSLGGGVGDREPNWDHEFLRRTLVTCVLSSGWNYEKALRASDLLCVELLGDGGKVPTQSQIEGFLRDARVRHRFPVVRAQQLHDSLIKLQDVSTEKFFTGSDIEEERRLRKYIAGKFGGIGLKQASMLLRDIGSSRSLAIVDSHILWYMKNIQGKNYGTLAEKSYIEIEDCMHNLSMAYDVSVNALDAILWTVVRSFKKYEREISCGMQYALPLEG